MHNRIIALQGLEALEEAQDTITFTAVLVQAGDALEALNGAIEKAGHIDYFLDKNKGATLNDARVAYSLGWRSPAGGRDE